MSDSQTIDNQMFIYRKWRRWYRERRKAVDTAVSLCRNGQHGIPVPDYTDENVSTKVVKIIQSYTGIVNKMVWRKF